jgi:hypothetical protein
MEGEVVHMWAVNMQMDDEREGILSANRICENRRCWLSTLNHQI